MPTNLQDDPNCNEKKKHIGNDFVKIIYNESGEEYNLTTISVKKMKNLKLTMEH